MNLDRDFDLERYKRMYLHSVTRHVNENSGADQGMNLLCAILSITVTAAIIALWLNNRNKHISSNGPYFSSRKAANFASLSTSPAAPSTSDMMPRKLSKISFWQGPILLLFFCNTAFLCQSSYFFFDLAVVGHFFAQVLLRHCLQFGLEL